MVTLDIPIIMAPQTCMIDIMDKGVIMTTLITLITTMVNIILIEEGKIDMHTIVDMDNMTDMVIIIERNRKMKFYNKLRFIIFIN
jgi:hypothetical protein